MILCCKKWEQVWKLTVIMYTCTRRYVDIASKMLHTNTPQSPDPVEDLKFIRQEQFEEIHK